MGEDHRVARRPIRFAEPDGAWNGMAWSKTDCEEDHAESFRGGAVAAGQVVGDIGVETKPPPKLSPRTGRPSAGRSIVIRLVARRSADELVPSLDTGRQAGRDWQRQPPAAGRSRAGDGRCRPISARIGDEGGAERASQRGDGVVATDSRLGSPLVVCGEHCLLERGERARLDDVWNGAASARPGSSAAARS